MKEVFKKQTGNSVVAALHVIAVLAGLPVIYKDYYFDILQIKYRYYLVCVWFLIAGILVCSIATFRPQNALKKMKGKQLCELLCITDVAVAAFFLVHVVSTYTSIYAYEAYWGDQRRRMGLFFLIWATAAYSF